MQEARPNDNTYDPTRDIIEEEHTGEEEEDIHNMRSENTSYQQGSSRNSISNIEKFKDEILEMNKFGLEFLKFEDPEKALRYFKAAERMLVKKIRSEGNEPTVMKLLSITLNNLACYNKKEQRFQIALRYLARVLQIEKYSLNDMMSLASSYLNVAAILSSLKKHKDALKFAIRANEMFIKKKEDLMTHQLNDYDYKKGQEEEDNTEDKNPLSISFRNSFIISFFNMGAEYQALGRKSEALEAYNQGSQFSEIDLGPDNPLTVRLKELAAQMKEELNVRMKKAQKIPIKQYNMRTNETSITYKDYNLFTNANNAFGINHLLDDQGQHSIKFDRLRNEVSIDREPPKPFKRLTNNYERLKRGLIRQNYPKRIKLPKIKNPKNTSSFQQTKSSKTSTKGSRARSIDNRSEVATKQSLRSNSHRSRPSSKHTEMFDTLYKKKLIKAQKQNEDLQEFEEMEELNRLKKQNKSQEYSKNYHHGSIDKQSNSLLKSKETELNKNESLNVKSINSKSRERSIDSGKNKINTLSSDQDILNQFEIEDPEELDELNLDNDTVYMDDILQNPAGHKSIGLKKIPEVDGDSHSMTQFHLSDQKKSSVPQPSIMELRNTQNTNFGATTSSVSKDQEVYKIEGDIVDIV